MSLGLSLEWAHLPALELALESKFRESGDSPMSFELSWRPEGSVGFLINLFGFFELTMVVVRGREATCLERIEPSTFWTLTQVLSPGLQWWKPLGYWGLSSNSCTIGILSLANTCLSLHHWLRHFKESVSVIILKPGKPAYDTPKAFRPIVLLNTLGKLIEKMIARQFQFDAVKYSILHPNQLGGVVQWSTEDAGVFLIHLVRAGWAKGLKTSIVAFDIA